jgi:hypothetical protein
MRSDEIAKEMPGYENCSRPSKTLLSPSPYIRRIMAHRAVECSEWSPLIPSRELTRNIGGRTRSISLEGRVEDSRVIAKGNAIRQNSALGVSRLKTNQKCEAKEWKKPFHFFVPFRDGGLRLFYFIIRRRGSPVDPAGHRMSPWIRPLEVGQSAPEPADGNNKTKRRARRGSGSKDYRARVSSTR